MKHVFIVFLIGMTFAMTALVYACAPASQRLTTFVTCPSNTTESVVVAYSTSNGKSSSAHSELHCIDPDGGGYEPSGPKIFFTLFAYVAVVLAMTVFALRFVFRAKRARKAKQVSS